MNCGSTRVADVAKGRSQRTTKGVVFSRLFPFSQIAKAIPIYPIYTTELIDENQRSWHLRVNDGTGEKK